MIKVEFKIKLVTFCGPPVNTLGR